MMSPVSATTFVAARPRSGLDLLSQGQQATTWRPSGHPSAGALFVFASGVLWALQKLRIQIGDPCFVFFYMFGFLKIVLNVGPVVVAPHC